jgi:hypothetical protein
MAVMQDGAAMCRVLVVQDVGCMLIGDWLDGDIPAVTDLFLFCESVRGTFPRNGKISCVGEYLKYMLIVDNDFI